MNDRKILKFLHFTYIWGSVSVFTFEVIDKSNRMHDFSVFFRTYHIPCLSCMEVQQLVFDHFWFEFLFDELFASHVSFFDQFSFSAWFSYQIVENVCCVCLFSISLLRKLALDYSRNLSVKVCMKNEKSIKYVFFTSNGTFVSNEMLNLWCF